MTKFLTFLSVSWYRLVSSYILWMIEVTFPNIVAYNKATNFNKIFKKNCFSVKTLWDRNETIYRPIQVRNLVVENKNCFLSFVWFLGSYSCLNFLRGYWFISVLKVLIKIPALLLSIPKDGSPIISHHRCNCKELCWPITMQPILLSFSYQHQQTRTLLFADKNDKRLPWLDWVSKLTRLLLTYWALEQLYIISLNS